MKLLLQVSKKLLFSKGVLTPLLLFLIIVGEECRDKGQQSISLLENKKFKLSDQEKSLPVDTALLNEYNSLFKDKSISIPFYKSIRGDGYMIFIGIPYQLSTNDLMDLYLLDPSRVQVKTYSDAKVIFYRTYKSAKINLVEQIVQINNNLLFILISASNEAIIEQKFTANQILSRICDE